MNFSDILRKITIKHVLFVLMCVLLVLMIVLFCIAGSKVSGMLQLLGPSTEPTETEKPTPSTTETTAPPTTGTTVPPTTQTAPPPTTEPPPPTTGPTEPPHEHSFRLKETVEATCTNYGYKIYGCSCGKQDIPLDQQVAPYGHSFSAEEPVIAGCENEGYTKYVCSRCGLEDVRNVEPALGHNFQLVETVPPACEVEGYTLYRCDNCDMEEMRDIVPAIQHSYEFVEERIVTCTEDGYTKSQCLNCGHELIENLMKAPGHNFGPWTPEADGSQTRTCSVCGLTESTAQIAVTNAQVSGEYVHDAQGSQYRMYLICVGTPTTPDLVHYTINDYLDNGTLTYTYDVTRGLVINYTTGSGETIEIVLPLLQSQTVEIPADSVSPSGSVG